MPTANVVFNEADFTAHFDALKALIHEEWPQLDAGALDATDGDAAAVIQLGAEQTEHTRALGRSQLGELQHVLTLQGGGPRRLEKAVKRLEEQVGQMRSRASNEWAPAARERVAGAKDKVVHARDEVESKMHEHILISLLIAVGFGVVFGLLVGGFNRGR